MTSKLPLITVLMTVRNGEKYIAEAIDSVIGQTFLNWRLLIVDNASTDMTIPIILEKQSTCHRIHVVELGEDFGQVGALRIGMAKVRAPFVARLDADDAMEPTRLHKQLAELKANSDVAIVGSHVRVLFQDGERGPKWGSRCRCRGEFLWRLVRGHNPFGHPTVMFRTKAVNDVGGYNPAYQYAEDYELWARLALAGYDARVIEEPLLRYRLHDGQSSHRFKMGQDAAKSRAHWKCVKGVLSSPRALWYIGVFLAGRAWKKAVKKWR